MDLTLSPDERTRFCAVLAIALSARRDGDDDERWARALAAALGALLGGASTAVVLQCGRAVRAYGDGIGDELLRRFVQTPHLPRLTPSPVRGALSASSTRTRVWCRAAPSPPHGTGGASPSGRQTDQPPPADGVTSGRWYNAVGATAELGLPEVCASIACHYQEPQTAEDTGRRLELLNLLLPAFAAAARARLLDASTHGQLTRRLLDTLGAGALLFSTDAGIFYENQVLARSLDAHPEGARLREQIERIARDASRIADADFSGRSVEERIAAATHELPTSSGTLEVRCTLVTPADAGRPATIAVAVTLQADAARTIVRSPAGLRERFRLTAREVDVTRMLSIGRSNAEIARDLGISPFTARRHTERVLSKLGARSRAEVPALLQEVPADTTRAG